MYYKSKFKIPVEPSVIENIRDGINNGLEIQPDIYSGSESVAFNGSRIELGFDTEGRVIFLEVCNECVKSYNAEKNLLMLSYLIAKETENIIELINHDLTSEVVDAEALENYI